MIRTRCWTVAFGLLAAVPLSAQTTAPAPAPAVVHVAFPDGSSTGLGAKVSALLAEPAAARAHWGIAVTALDGTPLYGLDEGKVFRPASNAKLFTTAAAMALLGPEKTFRTELWASGSVDGGTLHGDLVLKGEGDPNFAGSYALPYRLAAPGKTSTARRADSMADFDALAERVAASGIREVDGDVVGDDSYFENTPYPEGWAEEDVLWGYGAPVSALVVHDNLIDVMVEPSATPGARAGMTFEPALAYYTVASGPTVYTQDFGRNQVLVERAAGSREVTIVGDVAAKYGVDREQLAIAEPAEYAAMALKAALEAHGVQVKGQTRARHWDSGFVGSLLQSSGAARPNERTVPAVVMRPGKVACEAQAVAGTAAPAMKLLAEHVSSALPEDVKLTLKESENLHAEVLLLDLAAEKDCAHTLRDALRWERQFLLYAGLDGSDFLFYDGSGLSAKDLIAPRASVALLAYAAKQPWFAQWKDALPVGGVDGTLAGRFKDAPLKGHVLAKTGTLGETNALAGYLDAASGRQVIFSIMVDNHMPGSSDRATMDKLVAAIADAE